MVVYALLITGALVAILSFLVKEQVTQYTKRPPASERWAMFLCGVTLGATLLYSFEVRDSGFLAANVLAFNVAYVFRQVWKILVYIERRRESSKHLAKIDDRVGIPPLSRMS